MMELVLLGIVNVVLLMLLFLAFKLIRSDGSAKNTGTVDTASRAASGTVATGTATGSDAVIDLRDEADAAIVNPTYQPVARQAPAVEAASDEATDSDSAPSTPAEPTMPVYGDPVFTDDGSPLPDGAFEAPERSFANETDEPTSRPAMIVPEPTPPPIGSHASMVGLSRSAIVVDSSLNGSGPAPSELLFSIIQALGDIGFELTKNSPDYGLLADEDGNTASVDLTKRPSGTDRIAITIDSSRAVEALAMLEIWHRTRLGSSAQVRLSARIR